MVSASIKEGRLSSRFLAARIFVFGFFVALLFFLPELSAVHMAYAQAVPEQLDHSQGIGSDGSAQKINLANAVTISSVNMWLDAYFGNSCCGASHLAIYSDNGGVPGALITTSNGVSIDVCRWGVCSSQAGEYAYDLPSPVTLPAGSYWLTPVNDGGNGTTIYGSAADVYDGGYWTGNPGVDAYFRLNLTPPAVLNPQQYKSDHTTPIPENGTITENTVIVGAFLTAQPLNNVQLQVEVKPSTVQFTGNPDFTSGFVPEGSLATVTISVPALGDYKWQARTADDHGNFSPWQEFGYPGRTDFVVGSLTLPLEQLDHTQVIGSAGSAQKVTLANAVTISSVNMWLSGNPGNTCCVASYLAVYSDNNDAPGVLLAASYGIGMRVYGGGVYSPHYGEYAYDLPSPVTLPAGSYWLTPVNDGGNGTTIYGSAADVYDGGYWTGNPAVDAYFNLILTPVQPPVISGPRQFKSDATTPIGEGQTTMEDTVVFGATLQSSSTDQLRLEVEYTTSTTFTGTANVTSAPVSPGSFATATATGLADGNYRWRARVVDTVTQAASDWQEHGTTGNTDFVVHQVPLYTQVSSDFPNQASTTDWATKQYGNGGVGGFAEYNFTISTSTQYALVVNGKDDDAADGTRVSLQATLYEPGHIKNPISVQTLTWPFGDNAYKNVSADLGFVSAGSYKLRLASIADYFDPNNTSSSGNLDASLDWLELRGADNIVLHKEAEVADIKPNKLIGGITKLLPDGRTITQVDGYDCGRTISDCGCFLADAVMLLRYFQNPHQNDVTPLTLDDYLKANSGYVPDGRIDKNKIAKFTNYRLKYDATNSTTTANAYDKLASLLNQNVPTIIGESSVGHFIVGYTALATQNFKIRDPFWYNTKTLNDPATSTPPSVSHLRAYSNNFSGIVAFKASDGTISASDLTVAIGSPAEVLITDSQGRRLGKDPVTSTEYDEIPGGSYYVENIHDANDDTIEHAHDSKIASIENASSGQYVVQVIGTANGGYSLAIHSTDNQGISQANNFFGITEPNKTATYNISYNATRASTTTAVPQDITSPVITYTTVASQYLLNSTSVVFTYSAQDAGVGVAELNAFLDGEPFLSGTSLQFNHVGHRTITLVAKDFVGNLTTETINFSVVYSFSGFLPPVKSDGSGVYKQGRTLSIKFQLTDVNGQVVTSSIAQLFIAKVQNSITIGDDEIPLSTSGADTGNFFRVSGDQYIYNLGTGTLTSGTWQLKAVFDDGKNYAVFVSIKS